MKKKSLQNLKLNKKIIANLESAQLRGGVDKRNVTKGDACEKAASLRTCTTRKCGDQ